MSAPNDFLAWVTNPARTSDELFTVERLLEGVRGRPDWPWPADYDYEGQRRRRRERRFNPGYRPALLLDDLRVLAARAAEVESSGSHFGTDDRPLRNIEALRFFPGITELRLESSDVVDLSPLAPLLKIKDFHLSEYGDIGGCQPLRFEQCGEMPEVETAWLCLHHAWPDLRALAHWPKLRSLKLHVNILALTDVPELPALEVLQTNRFRSGVPLRDLRVFPAMPRIVHLILERTASLEGIERYPSVLNLELTGDFRDLTPLASLRNVTALKLQGEYFTDLAPLLRLPKLREIVFVRETPLDLSILSDAPQLRRVDFEHCDIMRPELAALNAALIPEENDFRAETPRPLPPLKFYIAPKKDDAGIKRMNRRLEAVARARAEFFGQDKAFARAELRAGAAVLQTRLDRLLGRGWGLITVLVSATGGNEQLSFMRYRDTVRIHEIIQLLREFSAECRFPCTFFVNVEPHGDMSYELEQMRQLEQKIHGPEGHWLKDVLEPDAVLRENEEHARHYDEKYELLEREHRYRLQQEQGDLVDPALLEPPPLPSDEVNEEKSEDENMPLAGAIEEKDEDAGEGGVAIAPPPPAPPETESLGEALHFYIQVNEEAVTALEHWVVRAEYSLSEKFVPWPDDADAESGA